MILYTIIAAAAAGIISLPVLGPNIPFLYGLALGTCIAVIALFIISRTVEMAADSGSRSPVIFGFVIRVLLYGGVLYLAAGTSVFSLAGAAIGLLLPHIALYVMHGLVPVIRRKIKREPEPVYVADTSSNLFIKEPWIVLYKNNRTYMTYRHYRKRRII